MTKVQQSGQEVNMFIQEGQCISCNTGAKTYFQELLGAAVFNLN